MRRYPHSSEEHLDIRGNRNHTSRVVFNVKFIVTRLSCTLLPFTANQKTVCIDTRAEEFGQNYVRSAATSVDKSENSPQFSYVILR